MDRCNCKTRLDHDPTEDKSLSVKEVNYPENMKRCVDFDNSFFKHLLISFKSFSRPTCGFYLGFKPRMFDVFLNCSMLLYFVVRKN